MNKFTLIAEKIAEIKRGWTTCFTSLSMLIKRFLFIIFSMFLVGCSNSGNMAPVSDYSVWQAKPEFYTVKKGDTLYSIAWRYGMNYKDLMAFNTLSGDDKIHPGQTLYMEKRYQAKAISVQKKQADAPTPKKSSVNKNKQVAVSNSPQSMVHSFDGRWGWPAKGELSNTFWSKKDLQKGIDIRGKLREPVLAAASGTVVYAGEGLRGYGKLIILKHSETYLSAYAHNSQLIVSNIGQKVSQGQKIALMGSSGTDRVKLHFQIRKKGVPVDPLKFLPKK